MKLKKILPSVLIGLAVGANAQNARVQVIHNSADAAASVVDVWATIGTNSPVLLLDDFAFREASPFVNVTAGVTVQLGIAPPTSTSVADTLINFNATFMNNETYVVVANGIISPTGYSPAPPLELHAFATGRESAGMTTNTDVLVYHGATDAPIVDVVEVGIGAGTIVDDLTYSDFSADYLELATLDYALQLRDEYSETTVAEYNAALSSLSLQGEAIVVVASGFLDPSNNSNGAAFGLYAALPTGGPMVQVPSKAISTARVQVIHNSADAAATTVDVWLDNTLLIDDFEFRTATPFIDAPAGVNFEVRIQPSTSMDTTNPIALFTYNLMGGSKYVLVANGIVSSTGYSTQPNFDIHVMNMGRERSTTMGNTDVLVFHGSTDAPTVDVAETSVPAGTIVDDLMYGMFSSYLELGTADYILAIQDMTGTTTVASFEAPLSTVGLEDSAIVVLASGFLDPSVNSNGPAFGLFAALASGGDLIELDASTPVGIEKKSQIEFSIFPNPATNFINIQGEEILGEVVEIFNTQGQFITSKQIQSSTEQIDISQLNRGMYLIKTIDGYPTFFMVE